MLTFSPRLGFALALAALAFGYGLTSRAYAQEPAAVSTVQPALETGCRPGDCPKQEATLLPPAAADATPPGGVYNSVDRPPPGAFLHPELDGDVRVEMTPTKRLPRLWPPIVLTCMGATLLVPAVTMLTLAFVDAGLGGNGDGEASDDSDIRTVDGLLTLAGSAAALTVGLIWLRRRKAARRQLQGDPEIAFGAQGLGARLQIRM